ncbi:MAG: hypothetical protein ACQETE_08915 [Bacteroidota bacterium]
MSRKQQTKIGRQLHEISDLSQQRLTQQSGFTRWMGIQGPNWLKYLLLVSFFGVFGLWLTSDGGGDRVKGTQEVVENVTSWTNAYDQDLLNDMGALMAEMGYGELSIQELSDLRDNGVTANFTAKIRDLGYTDVTLEELKSLRTHDVSATFTSMMHELGYDQITLDELKRLRDNGVTAYYTSNVHDLGYSDITIDELISLQNARMSISDIKRAQSELGKNVSIERLVRYGISNQ